MRNVHEDSRFVVEGPIYLRTFLLAEDTIIFMAPIKHEIQWFSTIKNSFSNGSDELLLFATITDP
jgi:hypothetical protein